MRWRLEMPNLSTARCVGCVMSGGLRVQTKEQAADLTEAFPGRAKPIRVGSLVREEPCMHPDQLADPAMYWQRAGRKCPRVDLPVELQAPGLLAMLLHADAASASTYLLSRPERRRARLYDRAMAALTSPLVASYVRAERQARAAASRVDE